MSVSACLKSASRLLAGGWARPPFPQLLDGADRDGSACPVDSEEIYSFTPRGALRAAAGNQRELDAAWDMIEAVACPLFHAEMSYALTPSPEPEISRQLMLAALGKPMGFDDWAARSNRTLKELLHVFDFAVLRSTRGDA